MRYLKRILAMLMALVMIMGLLAGCGSDQQPVADDPSTDEGQQEQSGESVQNVVASGEPQYGGHLNVHIPAGINGIDPVKYAQVWAYTYMGTIYENPLTRDADDQIAPGVCEYELSEDRLTLKLWPREGVTFHDGTAVEAEDVMASIARACSIGNSVRVYLGPSIASMEVEDNVLTIQFNYYSEMAWSRLAAYQTWIAVMPKEICEANPTRAFQNMEDVIGTGPYKMTDYELNVRITVERYEDYIPFGEGRTGYAGPKMAYLDSITFWQNSDYSSSSLAVMAGDYDISDVIETDYLAMAEAAGIVRQNMGVSNTGFVVIFNNGGGDNLCAKYPDLRKAIMAAMDMEEFADVVSDGAVVFGGAPVLDETYQTDIFESADWYGEPNQDVVDKYLEAARAAGYDDEPIQLIADTTDTADAYTLLKGYLDDAGINYKLEFMENATRTEFVSNANNNWDIKFTYPGVSFTPTTLGDDYLVTLYNSEKKDALLEELRSLEVGSDEYIAKWYEFAQQYVDDCSIVHFGILDWYWNYREGLHCDYEGVHPYFFNAYWDNPEEHQR